MNLKKILSIINAKIDKMIIDNKTKTKEYKRLIKLHYKLTH